jgi:hypothetical protein
MTDAILDTSQLDPDQLFALVRALVMRQPQVTLTCDQIDMAQEFDLIVLYDEDANTVTLSLAAGESEYEC